MAVKKINIKSVKRARPLSSTKSAKKKIIKRADKLLKNKPLTGKQKAFCREYVIDWNATRAYKLAYPKSTDNSARANSARMITKDNIQKYCADIQKDLEKLCGISKAKVLNEHLKLAFSSIAHLHNTWIELKQFELLTPEQKECIAEIDTKTERKYFSEYDPDKEDFVKTPYDVKYVKIKLYDKQKALDSISKMQGYDAPQKIEHSGEVATYQPTPEERKLRIEQLKRKLNAD
jgi:phage terminase small subunit